VNGEADVELDEEVASDDDYECSDEGYVGGIDEGPVGGIDEEAASDNVSIDDSDYDEEWQ
jgi:hypothetical protein